MTAYGLHGKLNARKGSGAALSAMLLEASRIVSSAAGCRAYIVSTDPSDGETIWVTEVWDTKADHDASLALPAVRDLIGKAIPLLSEMPQKGQELIILGGHPL